MPERAPIRTAVPVALLAAGLLLTGCGTAATGDPAAPPATAPATASATGEPSKSPDTAVGAAPAAGSLGGAGTACALPVSFSLAKDWRPKAVRDPENPEFAELTRQGPATVRCEVDAKPAGNIGFLRVWTAPKGAARATLEGFVKAEKGSTGAVYKETKAGALPAVEVVYSVHSELLDETKEERAFAVESAKGTVIVHLGGLDSEEHKEMRPAYELARTSLKPL
ncbi:lipoprotein [Streptomyces sp. NPDC053493]|uniref:lipoprotein n=1 Tax=Streptomyces sp. NPDC053493 TaxID=3365705 RepID=UPI0037D083E6